MCRASRRALRAHGPEEFHGAEEIFEEAMTERDAIAELWMTTAVVFIPHRVEPCRQSQVEVARQRPETRLAACGLTDSCNRAETVRLQRVQDFLVFHECFPDKPR